MILVNTDNIEGKKIAKTLGLVKGNTIRAKWIGKDIIAGLRQLVGGELKEYTEMLTEARKQATERMIKEAESIGADAIINIRFTTSQIMQNAAEILVYGTAVKLK
ncbi:MAG: YbjQ family protein [Nanoarchaeota archaeon]|nr:YbjQ family protein [Nanoarchaeota archaeon]MBU1031061.1 YbjQ family protein [Nanoarchaeota archaeon]MBU1850085.1 YbjQ family protein [Nanoarchaeota archaeon]